MKRITKAVIPAAGLGTRFLPATKAMPKEMLPIVDIPTIQYIVEEAVSSGIETIVIITNGNKHTMENHFDIAYELEKRLEESGKQKELDLLNSIASHANICYVRQREPKGLGHAILCARPIIGDEPFAVLLGDDVVVNKFGDPSLKQLMQAYEKTNSSVVGVQSVKVEDVSKYGIVTPSTEINSRLVKLKGVVEKPSIEEAPSNLAILGRYILDNKIFDLLETQTAGKGNEIQLTDAIMRLMETEEVYAYDFEGKRYDVGDRFGFVQATIDFALERDDLKKQVLNYLKEVIEKN